MAERRMFAKTIIDSDAFLEMPMSSQLLYFHLAMRADDDGFVNKPKSIMRMCGGKDDDMRVLLAKKFVLGFDDGVVVIKHWRIHNYIQKDRYVETKYKEDKALLSVDENNAYTFDEGFFEEVVGEELSDARKKRIMAYKRSELPYSFSYKIRNSFRGEKCPICGITMGVPVKDEAGVVSRTPDPSIQHNIPISKGGKHELSNISVVCQRCNITIKDKETTALNNALVVEKWNQIIGNVSNPETQVRLGKVSIGKSNSEYTGEKTRAVRPPSLEEVEDYVREKGYSFSAEEFYSYYDSQGWKKANGQKLTNWHSACVTWERKEREKQKSTPARKNSFHNFDERNTDYSSLIDELQR